MPLNIGHPREQRPIGRPRAAHVQKSGYTTHIASLSRRSVNRQQ
jgi:hypothetical protein